jgi:hypothetical protein
MVNKVKKIWYLVVHIDDNYGETYVNFVMLVVTHFYMYGLKISDVVAKNFELFLDRVLCKGNFTEIYLKLEGLSILNNE